MTSRLPAVWQTADLSRELQCKIYDTRQYAPRPGSMLCFHPSPFSTEPHFLEMQILDPVVNFALGWWGRKEAAYSQRIRQVFMLFLQTSTLVLPPSLLLSHPNSLPILALLFGVYWIQSGQHKRRCFDKNQWILHHFRFCSVYWGNRNNYKLKIYNPAIYFNI